jgi:mannose-6-phosphate isomerase
MATSDDVVRVGLTPKLKDVDTLVEMLTYNHGPARLLEPVVDGKSKLFKPPVDEFRMLDTRIGKGEDDTLKGGDGPGIVLVYGGRIGIDWKAVGSDCDYLHFCNAFYSTE